MSAFFESEIIKDALDDINKLQEDVYGKLVHFHMMTYDEQIDHVDHAHIDDIGEIHGDVVTHPKNF